MVMRWRLFGTDRASGGRANWRRSAQRFDPQIDRHPQVTANKLIIKSAVANDLATRSVCCEVVDAELTLFRSGRTPFGGSRTTTRSWGTSSVDPRWAVGGWARCAANSRPEPTASRSRCRAGVRQVPAANARPIITHQAAHNAQQSGTDAVPGNVHPTSCGLVVVAERQDHSLPVVASS